MCHKSTSGIGQQPRFKRGVCFVIIRPNKAQTNLRMGIIVGTLFCLSSVVYKTAEKHHINE